MTPLYFFPDLTAEQLTRERLLASEPAAALRDVLDTPAHYKQSLIRADLHYGPSGSSGALVAATPGDSEPLILFKPDQQKWVNCGEYWLGYYLEHPPTPAELERRDQVNGFLETLGDGNEWNCPVIRTPTGVDAGEVRVPREFGLDEQGEMIIQPLEVYRAAWDASAIAWDFIIAKKKGLSVPDGVKLAAQFLGLNYRVGFRECLLLNLFNENNLQRVYVAACDRDFCDTMFDQLEKKST
jgi:hypothetical protein